MLTVCAGILVLFYGCTATRVSPRISDYCKRISGTDDVKSSGVKKCMDHEVKAEKKLHGMTIPWHVDRYCRHISEQTGGSYQVMLTCVEEEMNE